MVPAQSAFAARQARIAEEHSKVNSSVANTSAFPSSDNDAALERSSKRQKLSTTPNPNLDLRDQTQNIAAESAVGKYRSSISSSEESADTAESSDGEFSISPPVGTNQSTIRRSSILRLQSAAQKRQGAKAGIEDNITPATKGSDEDEVTSSDEYAPETDKVASSEPALQLFTAWSLNGVDKRIITERAKECHFRLKDIDSLVLVGIYDLWVYKGVVSIDGALIRASSRIYRIFAPSTHALPLIRTLPNPFKASDQCTELAIISCSPGLRSLRKVCPKFARIWNHGEKGKLNQTPEPVRLHQRTFVALRSSHDDRYKRPLRPTDHTSDATQLIEDLLARNKDAFAVMVCGPKNSGKSTLARRLLNVVLTRGRSGSKYGSFSSTSSNAVIWLDLDPGQPEFSPPGMLSLVYVSSCKFGPSYTHPITGTVGADNILRSHYIGALSSSTDPGYYLQCASDLIDYYRSKLSGQTTYPLIINCSGWVLGTGLELLVEIIRYRFLTDVIYTSLGPSEVVDSLRTVAQNERLPLHLLKSHDVGFEVTASANLRTMQYVSYFHSDGVEGDNLRWNSEPLSGRAPLVAHFAGQQQAILGVLILGDDLDPDLYMSVLEGCIVGVVIVEESRAIVQNSRSLYTDEPAPASTNSSSTVEQGNLLAFAPAQGELSGDGKLVNGSVPPSGLSMQHDASSLGSSQDHVVDDDGLVDDTPIHLRHPLVIRNDSDLPCIVTGDAITAPLDPKYSYCIGQALVQSIDADAKTFHLLTPIKSEFLQQLHQQGKRLVLVRGRTDTPVWAYEEDLHLMRSRLKVNASQDETAKLLERQATKDWAEGIPWAHGKSSDRSRLRKTSWKPWRARRDIRYAGEDSD